MIRSNFLRDLRNELAPLSFEEQEQIIDEYLSIFEIKKDEGLSDDEIIEELGSPQEIAQEFLKEFAMDNEYQYPGNESTSNRNIVLFGVVLTFDILIGVWLLFVFIAFLLVLILTGIALIIISLILPFTLAIKSILATLASIFVCIGLGLLLIALGLKLAQLGLNLFKKHIEWLRRLL
ncbi:DUF1700 domain-containing protein [Erysipelotrichaceae bacterium OttesenSCG-928-M19]|nr:DUF1700 domain-containing protein [Erysipelotrichaceae bacterium OttesenSCG-928-M19]